MDFLLKVVERKKEEVRSRKKNVPISLLKDSKYYSRKCISLKTELLKPESSRIIAEIKRASPSAGMLYPDLDIKKVAEGYHTSGVAGISILTDFEGFKGSIDDISMVRDNIDCPILRKDFIIDPYQIEEARSIGADVVLIIASAMSPERAHELCFYAKDLGLEVLFEVHDKSELDEHLNEYIDFVGVNNRNLKTLKVDIETSVMLSKYIDDRYIKISESGLSESSAILKLKKFGYQGFLIGEHFMRTDDPAHACKKLISEIS